jgi:hypothetical protein
VPVFLVTLSLTPIWSADAAGRHLAEQLGDVEVVRAWTTPDPGADFLVVTAPAEADVEDAARQAELSLGPIAALQLEGDATAADDLLIAGLPRETPRTLRYLDVTGYVPERWVYCKKCDDVHPEGRHTR